MLWPLRIICLFIIVLVGTICCYQFKWPDTDDLRLCPIEAIINDNSHKYFNISDFGNITANGSVDLQFLFKLDAIEFCTVLTTKANFTDTLHSHAVCLRDSAPSYIWRYPLIESDRSLVLRNNIHNLRIIINEETMQVKINNDEKPFLVWRNIENIPINFFSFQIPFDGTLIIFHCYKQGQEY